MLLSVPLAAVIVARVHRIDRDSFDPAAARAAIHLPPGWTTPEKRLLPVFLLTVLLWVTRPLTEGVLPQGRSR